MDRHCLYWANHRGFLDMFQNISMQYWPPVTVIRDQDLSEPIVHLGNDYKTETRMKTSEKPCQWPCLLLTFDKLTSVNWPQLISDLVTKWGLLLPRGTLLQILLVIVIVKVVMMKGMVSGYTWLDFLVDIIIIIFSLASCPVHIFPPRVIWTS